ncbi:hypothetical protein E1B28_010946 [Marasmius oreades]|uniref:Transposase domain-containing protein n=1 Tax=Marasmius oreades TaxID=181124 RepID=A0A9P7RT89_9AGAR|nr:uncharacterized protein E1B28_010946 [Marasmius oreades]KAG7089247.1 hypothetical protein E1B28_010946 [Marasmius oreades]
MSTQRKKPRKYTCTCQRFCRARLPEGKVVSKSLYYLHAKQRELENGLTIEELQNVEGRIRRKRQRTSYTHPQSTRKAIEEDPNQGYLDADCHTIDTILHNSASSNDEFFGAGADAGYNELINLGLDNDAGNSSDYEDNSNNLDDDLDSIENPYGEAASARPDVAPTNIFVESNVDGIQEMINFVHGYDFEEERKQWTEEQWHQFLNPPRAILDLSDSQLRISLHFYLILSHTSEETYTRLRQVYNQEHPDRPLLSYDQTRRRLHAITGVFPLCVDKCKNNCLAFYGPYTKLLRCPHCDEERFDHNKKPRSTFTTIPIGPQLQALWRHPESAEALHSRSHRTTQVLKERYSHEGVKSYSDIIHGSDYLDTVENGTINEDTMVLLYSEDAAQLYRDKQSSTLFGIAILGDLDPDVRHLEHSVMPLFVVGGPNAATHDSFKLPTLAHLAACQRHGIPVWDGLLNKSSRKFPFLLFALADTVAMAHMSKSVGHHGCSGCWLLCEMPGRHKPRVGTYYPALLRPDGNNLPPSSAHPDIDVDLVTTPTLESYRARLSLVVNSTTLAQYKRQRKKTGIRGPSLFSALPQSLPCPKLFPADLMHLVYNIGQLMLQLFRGTIEHDGADDLALADFTILYDPDDFAAFGTAVACARLFIPTDVEKRAPRNPAEKINSGYKASEYHTLIFGLCPGLLYGRLPDYLYTHFCQLVLVIRLVHRRYKTYKELLKAQQNLKEFVVLFEHYYYQRKLNRLHFVRPCIAPHH